MEDVGTSGQEGQQKKNKIQDCSNPNTLQTSTQYMAAYSQKINHTATKKLRQIGTCIAASKWKLEIKQTSYMRNTTIANKIHIKAQIHSTDWTRESGFH